MLFAVIKNGSDPRRDAIASAIVKSCLEHGHRLGAPDEGVKFVLNLTDTDSPRSFRRRAQSVFVFSLVTLDRPPDSLTDLRSVCYTTLIRTLSNVLLCAVPKTAEPGNGGEHAYEMYFTTPEAGFYHLGSPSPTGFPKTCLNASGGHRPSSNGSRQGGASSTSSVSCPRHSPSAMSCPRDPSVTSTSCSRCGA
jgi:hypothetical protein